MPSSDQYCAHLMAKPQLCEVVTLPYQKEEVAKTAQEIGGFSTFSGILAAFAFASLMILITNPPEVRHQKNFAVGMFSLVMVVTFLLLSTFLFIPISGSSFRPLQEGGFIIAEMMLSLAVAALFFCLPWFFYVYKLPGVAFNATIMMFIFVVVVIILNIPVLIYDVKHNMIEYYKIEPSKSEFLRHILILSVPVVLAGCARLLWGEERAPRVSIFMAKFGLYASFVFSITLVGCYVYLFSPFWDVNSMPFLIEVSDLFVLGLGVIIGIYVLALPPLWAMEDAVEQQ